MSCSSSIGIRGSFLVTHCSSMFGHTHAEIVSLAWHRYGMSISKPPLLFKDKVKLSLVYRTLPHTAPPQISRMRMKTIFIVHQRYTSEQMSLSMVGIPRMHYEMDKLVTGSQGRRAHASQHFTIVLWTPDLYTSQVKKDNVQQGQKSHTYRSSQCLSIQSHLARQ